MSINDEELQHKIEAKVDVQHSVDADAYRTVFGALNQQPDFHLKRSFADDVVQKLTIARELREYRKDMFWFGVGMFALVVGMIACFVFILPYLKIEKVTSGFSGLLQYKGLILVTVIMFILFGWLDRKLIKPHQMKSE